MGHDLGDPDRVAGQVLAGEDAHAAGVLVERPAEDVELGLTGAAAGKVDRAAEMHGAERLEAAGLQLRRARGGVVGGEGGALDALALREEVAGGLVLVGLGEHPEQLEVVVDEHGRVVAGAEMRRMGATGRHGEADPFPGLRGGVEVANGDHDMVGAET